MVDGILDPKCFWDDTVGGNSIWRLATLGFFVTLRWSFWGQTSEGVQTPPKRIMFCDEVQSLPKRIMFVAYFLPWERQENRRLPRRLTDRNDKLEEMIELSLRFQLLKSNALWSG